MSKKAKKKKKQPKPKQDPIRRKCPNCQKYVNVGVRDLKVYRCPDCRMLFDDDPDDETVFHNDPHKNLEMKERYEARKRRR